MGVSIVLVMVPLGCDESAPPAITPTPVQKEFQGNIVVPDSWQGTWHAEVTFLGCESEDIVAVEDIVFDLCSGDSLALSFSNALSNCEGLNDGSQLHAICRNTFLDKGCVIDLTFAISAEQDLGTLSGEGVWVATVRGTCAPLYRGGCEEIMFTATRLSAVPDCESNTLRSGQNMRGNILLINAITARARNQFVGSSR
jgi:hypothetical protein